MTGPGMTGPGTTGPNMTGPNMTGVIARARDVLGSEWTKFCSVRSTFWTLLVAVLTPVGLSAVIAAALASSPGPGADQGDALLPGLLSMEYAVLAVGVLGVLAFSTEYSTGLIRTTFAAVPRRRAVLAAKAAVIGVATLIAGEVVAFISFALVQAVLAGHHSSVSLSRPGVPGAVLADGLLLFVVAMMGVGLGAIVRHTAGGIAALAGLIFLPSVAGVLPAPWAAGSASSPCLTPPARSPRCTRTRTCSPQPGRYWFCWPGPPPRCWPPPPSSPAATPDRIGLR
jgi:ABC-2 type transport system permease protein